MKYELLPPDSLSPQLIARHLELHNLLTLKLKAQKNAPAGHLRIEQKRGGHKNQFYHCKARGDLRGTYIPRAQTALARKLAQKDYDVKLIKLLQKRLTILEKLLSSNETKITDLYSKLCPARQCLIEPVTLTDSQYIAEWNRVIWDKKPFSAEIPNYLTGRNEQVRSKSEVIIADTLARYNIAYRYEYPLILKNGHTFHPDFLCLNVRTRKEFLWEHFGMMDQAEYAKNTAIKLDIYSENDIYPGRNLIITMETQECPLSTRQIEKLIKEFLL